MDLWLYLNAMNLIIMPLNFLVVR